MPLDSQASGAMSRAVMSVGPPAENGTTMRIGFDGYGCAGAPPDPSHKPQAASHKHAPLRIAAQTIRINDIVSSRNTVRHARAGASPALPLATCRLHLATEVIVHIPDESTHSAARRSETQLQVR